MTEHNEIPVQDSDEFDDVEGHGLKEVATAGVIGAAVLGAGGAAALAASSGHGPGPTPVVSKPAIVAQTQSDANQLVGDAAQGVGGLAHQTVSDTQSLASHTVSQATSIAAPEVHIANQTVRDADTLVRDDVQATTTIAGNTERVAFHTTSATEHTATTTAGKTTTTATNEASTAETAAIQVVKATEDRLGNGWTLDLSVLGMHANTGGNMLAPNGTVSIIDGSGNVIASANVVNGAATVHYKLLGSSKSVTIHYSGNSTYASVDLPWLSPKP